MRLNPLKTSLKPKKRFLAYEIISESKINNFSDVSREIWDKMTFLVGNLALAEAHMVVLKDTYAEEKQRGVIKINHKYVNELKAGLCLVQKIGNFPVILKTLGVSGILKKAKAKYIA
jgi:ribonuclease P/MRP protein subunit POP5